MARELRSKGLRELLLRGARDRAAAAAELRESDAFEKLVAANEAAAQQLFSAHVVAETIRDGFVVVARAIRASMPDPGDY